MSTTDSGDPPMALVERLGMQPHPEGGWYVETYRAPAAKGDRAAMTAIYFLLDHGQRSHWHKIDASELWLWHRGAPLHLKISEDGARQEQITLGPEFSKGQHLQGVVPKDAWQSAEAVEGWVLVSCVVAPAFEFDRFTLAPPDWQPGLSP